MLISLGNRVVAFNIYRIKKFKRNIIFGSFHDNRNI